MRLHEYRYRKLKTIEIGAMSMIFAVTALIVFAAHEVMR